MNLNGNFPWATVGLWALTIIVAVVGGAVVIWGPPGALSFDDYVKVLSAFGVAQGLLGVGRGVNSGLTNHALLSAPIVTESTIPPDSDEKPGSVVAVPEKTPRSHV